MAPERSRELCAFNSTKYSFYLPLATVLILVLVLFLNYSGNDTVALAGFAVSSQPMGTS